MSSTNDLPDPPPTGSPGSFSQRRSPVLLRDVARLAGVHISTASRVLNGRSDERRISDETVHRVQLAARRLHYLGNGAAQTLRTGRSMCIGLLVPDIANPYQAGIARAAADRLSEAGYSVLIGNTDDTDEILETQLRGMVAAQVDGLLYGVARIVDPWLDVIHNELQVPCVLFNRAPTEYPFAAVIPDERDGIRQAVEHLLSLGHTHLLHVGGAENLPSAQIRRAAFLDFTSASGAVAHTYAALRRTELEGHRVTLKAFADHPMVTGIVAENDRLAIGALDAIRELGFECPRDISIVGFNDMKYIDHFDPPLTSVRVSQHEIGVRIASLLLDQISGQSVTRLEQVPVQLIVRGSTAPPPIKS